MVIIIGAGISGLSAGSRLKHEFTIFEKNNSAGGLCNQYQSGGYWFDYGGHYFHFQGKEKAREYINQYVRLIQYQRNSKLFMLKRYIPFPLQNHLAYLPSKIKNKIVRDLNNLKDENDYSSLNHFLVCKFGESLVELFFRPFLQKYYLVGINQLAANMDKGSIPAPEKSMMIRSAKKKGGEPIGYNRHFFYPREGLRSLIDRMRQGMEPEIRLNHEISEINLKKKTIKTRDEKSFRYDFLINTMPLNNLLSRIADRSFNPSPPLRHTSTLIVNSVLKRKRKRFHWVYLPENKFSFYRAGFYPFPGIPTCYLEKSIHLDQIPDDSAIRSDAIQALMRLGLIENQWEILHLTTRIIPVSYVIFDQNWKLNVPPILETLRQNRVYSIGRYGSWNYSSMSEDVLTALHTADEINQHCQ